LAGLGPPHELLVPPARRPAPRHPEEVLELDPAGVVDPAGQQAGEGLARDLRGDEAEEPLRRPVELADPALIVDRHDRVGGGVDEVAGLLLALPERLLGLPPPDEVLLLRASRLLEDRHRAPLVLAEQRREHRGHRDGQAVRDDGEIVPPVEVHPLGVDVVEDPVVKGGEHQDEPVDPPIGVDDQERHDHEEVEVHLDRAATDEHEQVGVRGQRHADQDAPGVVVAQTGARPDRDHGGEKSHRDRARPFLEGRDPPGERGREVPSELQDRVAQRQEDEKHPVPLEHPDHEPVDLRIVQGVGVPGIDVCRQEILHVPSFPSPRRRHEETPSIAIVIAAVPTTTVETHPAEPPASPIHTRQSSGS
jgi:hypothetical protein